MTPELLLLLTLIVLLLAIYLGIGWWLRHIEHARQQRQERERRVIEIWHEPPPNNHGSAGGNHTA